MEKEVVEEARETAGFGFNPDNNPLNNDFEQDSEFEKSSYQPSMSSSKKRKFAHPNRENVSKKIGRDLLKLANQGAEVQEKNSSKENTSRPMSESNKISKQEPRSRLDRHHHQASISKTS